MFNSLINQFKINKLAGMPRRKSGVVSLGGFKFDYIDAASFLSSYKSIFTDRVYHFISNTECPRILDCGANIGLASIYLRSVFPKAIITAFEPDPIISVLLKKNLASANVEVIEAAVWNQGGEISFKADGADGGCVAPNQVGCRVPAIRLADWLHEPVDFLKIDIEGAELPVLRDCRDLLKFVQNIAVEYHEFSNGSQNLDELLRILSENGFRYHLHSKGSPIKPLANRFGPKNCGQLLDIFACRV
jgi:FkbM family methyltransferase